MYLLLRFASNHPTTPFNEGNRLAEAALLVINNARQIFNCQRSDFLSDLRPKDAENHRSAIFDAATATFGFFQIVWWAWVDSNYRPHPYQGCALTT